MLKNAKAKGARKPQKRVTKKTWGDYYYQSLGRGDDHGYAAYHADRSMKRDLKRKATP
jgi:hypothetical protein